MEFDGMMFWNIVMTLIFAPIIHGIRSNATELKRIDILLNKTREESAMRFVTKEELIMKKNEIGKLSHRLNVALLKCFDENTGRVGEFDTAACKDIIDEIDDLLGELYGLIYEEVEFIKNYDKHIRPNRSR